MIPTLPLRPAESAGEDETASGPMRPLLLAAALLTAAPEGARP